MMDTTADNPTSSPAARPRLGGDFRPLAWILLSIVIGVLVGVFYGRSMWLAAGGPEGKIQRLEDTVAQKSDRADSLDRKADEDEARGDVARAADNRREAARLRSHVPVIQTELDAVRTLARHAETDRGTAPFFIAQIVWEFSQFAGDLFLQVLRLLVIPLVVTSMICGITSLGDVRKVGRLGGLTISYYLSTGAVAVVIGIILVQVIRPGVQADDTFAFVTESVAARQDAGVLDTLLNVFRGTDKPGSGMFPSNIILAAGNTNVLALIAFALVFGAALTTVGEKGRVAIDFFQGANEAVMKMVHMVMVLAPIGIYGLVAGKIAENGGGAAFGEELARLGWYVATVLTGLAVHLLVLGSLLPLLARRNPFVYSYHILRALLTAMSTASSSATLPVTMECVEDRNKVSQRSAGFVLPLGATVNMDGTALYEAVAAIFIAQSLGIELGLGHLVVIFLTATLAAIGAAGIPEAGLVTMVIVLAAVGLPMSGIGTILAIDWFLDRMRTTVNVYGDAVGAAVIDHLVPDGES